MSYTLPSTRLGTGARVLVRTRYQQQWARGFEIADIELTLFGPRYALRRFSDGAVLPRWFTVDDLRAE